MCRENAAATHIIYWDIRRSRGIGIDKYDNDIPEDVGTIIEIISTFSIKKGDSDDRILTIPVIIEVNAAD